MKKAMVTEVLVGIVLTACMVFSSCSKQQVREMQGTLEGPFNDSIPEQVAKAMTATVKFHNHEIMNDTAYNISVFGVDETDLGPTEGYGIVVVNGAESTTFPQIQHAREPLAVFDPATGDLWLTSCVMSGTGVQVERLYRIRFFDDGKAYIAGTIDPYDIQQYFLKQIGYTTEGEQITLYINQEPSGTFTNTVTDMGGFDDDALWVGEQIAYDLSGPMPRVCVTPGVKFVTGLVLHYEDVPSITGDITMDDSGAFTVSDLRL